MKRAANWSISIAATLALGIGYTGAISQAAPQDEKLPAGSAVLDKYVEAMGGAAAFQSIKTRVVEATMEIPAAGLALNVTVYASAPDNIYTVASSPATGKIESGTSGGVAWEISQQRGVVLKDGSERDDALRDARFDRLIRWRDNVKSAECTGTATVDGKPAYKVLVTPKTGTPQTFYFDRSTGLIVQVESTTEAAGSRFNVTTKPSDYRKVDGILMPFSNRAMIIEAGQERVVTIMKVENNVTIPADRFALPAEIKALVSGKK